MNENEKSLTPDEFHLLLRKAASRARRHRPSWMDTQDLTQVAELALLEAKRSGRLQPAENREHLLRRTKLRAFGAMIDAIRSLGSRGPNNTTSINQTGAMPLYDRAGPDDPVRTVQLKRAVEHLALKGSDRQLECITLVAAGLSMEQIAAVMDVSPSRVSQLKREARELMSVWGEL